MALHSNKARLCRFKVSAIAAFSVALAIAETSASAQQLPAAPEPQTTQPHVQRALAALSDPVSFSSSTPSAPAYTAEYTAARPATNPRIADSEFFLINGLHLGLAVADVELTQQCIASHQCREGNPLMPSSQAGQLSVILGTVTLASVTSYWFKKHQTPHWWLPPAAGIVGHSAGVASGFIH